MVKGVCGCSLVCIPAAWLGSVHYPASLSVLWPCDSPQTAVLLPALLRNILFQSVLICNSYFNLHKVAICDHSETSDTVPFFPRWLTLNWLSFISTTTGLLLFVARPAEEASASWDLSVFLPLIARWHRNQLKGLMYEECAHPSAWLLCIVISFPTGMFLHFVSEQNCVKLK